MPTCCVAGCTKEKRNAVDPDHKFFSFPRKSPLIEKWIKFCRKDSLTKEQCMNGQRVCSIHFKEEYIEIPLKYRLLPQFAPKNMRTLRKDAVPTIRNPKKKKEDEDDEKQRKKKLEYSRIVAELLEQSEKDAAAEKERLEKEAAEAANEKEAADKDGAGQNVKQDQSTPAGKKTPKSKKQSTSPSKQKSTKKIKIEQTSPDTTKSKKGNKSSKSSDRRKKVSFADPDLQNQHPERPDTDDEVEACDSDFQTEGVDTDNDVVNQANQQAEENAAELLRLMRENKKLTDLTIKQSLQIADLIKQRNDLWREKGDLWFRKRMDPQ